MRLPSCLIEILLLCGTLLAARTLVVQVVDTRAKPVAEKSEG